MFYIERVVKEIKFEGEIGLEWKSGRSFYPGGENGW
jgi:hypothetical protein